MSLCFVHIINSRNMALCVSYLQYGLYNLIEKRATFSDELTRQDLRNWMAAFLLSAH